MIYCDCVDFAVVSANEAFTHRVLTFGKPSFTITFCNILQMKAKLWRFERLNWLSCIFATRARIGFQQLWIIFFSRARAHMKCMTTIKPEFYEQTCTLYSAAIVCVPPQTNPINGDVSCTNDNFLDSTCTYSCNPGFVLDGFNTATCLLVGSSPIWDIPAPTCIGGLSV